MRSDLILNLRAHRLRREPRLAERVEALARGRARVWPTRCLDELDRVAGELAADPGELLVLCGGDGTYMAGVTALRRAMPPERFPTIVLAPAGTVATVARRWGQRGDVLDVVRAALRSRDLRGAATRPTLAIDEDGGEGRVGFIFGTGLVARFFDRYYGEGATGYAGAARIVARVFAGSFSGSREARSILDPLPCTVSVDGRRLGPRAFSLVVASVIRDVGLHMLVTHRAAEDPLRPHLVASPLPAHRLGPQLFRVLFGRKLLGTGNFDGLVERFEVEFTGEAGPYVLDGDMFEASRIAVTAGPRIRVLAVEAS